MKSDLILVSRPDDPALGEALKRAEALRFKHMASLSSGEALVLHGTATRHQLASAFDGLCVDWCLHSGMAKRKALLICDMDSTIIGQECLDELADLAGFGKEVRAITEAAMAGDLDFEDALRTRVRLLQGKPIALLRRCFDERITLNPGARTLAQTMRKGGAMTALVSGGFTFFSDQVAKLAGFADHQANVLLHKKNVLSGDVASPVLGRNAKAAALQHYCQAGGISAKDALAIGDGANDIAMIEIAGLGVAWRPKPILARASDAQIRFTNLTTALFFQGIARRDFVVN